MSTPSNDSPDGLTESSDGRNYASDRHLLLKEVQVLAKEVARLRGDTKHLNEVIIPREEHVRRRKVNTILAGLTVSLFSLAMIGLYLLSSEISRNGEALKQTTYEVCLAREAQAASAVGNVIEINALLASLRDTESELLSQGDASLREIRDRRVGAYNRYLDFVEAQSASPAGPKAPSCESLLR